jgi:hypothetical protein
LTVGQIKTFAIKSELEISAMALNPSTNIVDGGFHSLLLVKSISQISSAYRAFATGKCLFTVFRYYI